MKGNELKWYITSQIGSKISKNKLLNNKQVYKKLQHILETDNINVILKYLQGLGFILIEKKGSKCDIDPEIKIYHIEPNTYKKSKDDIKKDSVYKGYLISKSINKEKEYQKRCNEKYREKIKYELSKPYYRENTNYNSIW
jgi:hypothetical protein